MHSTMKTEMMPPAATGTQIEITMGITILNDGQIRSLIAHSNYTIRDLNSEVPPIRGSISGRTEDGGRRMEIDGEVPSLAQSQIYLNLRYHQRYSRQSSSPTVIPGRITPLDLHFLELLQKPHHFYTVFLKSPFLHDLRQSRRF